MFETSIINKLAAETDLVSYLNTYNSSPSIFSNEAPEDADFPYIVIRIDGGDPYGPVQDYNMYVDIMDYYDSRAGAREAAFWVKVALDEIVLTHDRFIDLRIYPFAGPTHIEEESDPRSIQINSQFTIRVTRSKWMINAK